MILIPNLDEQVQQSLKYISSRVNKQRVEVFDTYLKCYDKQVSRYTYKTQEFKLNALGITGRYYRKCEVRK